MISDVCEQVSHELRTPMAALSAELDLALQKERTVTQYQNSIHNALQDSQRVIELIDGLLTLPKRIIIPSKSRKRKSGWMNFVGCQ
ncbi:MAG: histidine kinase dimerization/phospho-acceptor domain-containing protein [Bacteroides sp.]